MNTKGRHLRRRKEMIKVAATTSTSTGIDLEPKLSVLPWREFLWPWKRFISLFSPTTWGFRVPRGDGSAVVLVPGFMGTDNYLARMYWWLWLIGYTPVMSGIGVNARCIKLLYARLLKTIREAFERSGRKVTIYGHSLGGTIALIVALDNPNMVAQVILCASPIRTRDGAIQLNPVTVGTAKVVRFLQSGEGPYPDCLTPSCDCLSLNMIERVSRSLVKVTAIYTRSDGIVDWRNTVFGNPDVDVEVKGPHMALPYNPQVYRVIADILSGNGINERAVA